MSGWFEIFKRGERTDNGASDLTSVPTEDSMREIYFRNEDLLDHAPTKDLVRELRYRGMGEFLDYIPCCDMAQNLRDGKYPWGAELSVHSMMKEIKGRGLTENAVDMVPLEALKAYLHHRESGIQRGLQKKRLLLYANQRRRLS